MAKSDKIIELYEWMERNKIQYSKVDSDVIDIPGFGKAYFQDTQRSTYNYFVKMWTVTLFSIVWYARKSC
jgi:hypothetical protein